MKKKLLILTIILVLQNASAQLETFAAVVEGAKVLVDFLKNLVTGVHSMKDLLRILEGSSDSIQALGREEIGQLKKLRTEFLMKFEQMHTVLNDLKLYTADRFDSIQNVLNHLPHVLGIIVKEQVLGEFVTSINNKWDEVRIFLRVGVRRDVYSTIMIAHAQYIEQNLGNFRSAVSPEKTQNVTTDGLFVEIAKMHQHEKDVRCNGQTSHHDIVHLYQIVLSTELKAFVLQVMALSDSSSANKTWDPMIDYTLTSLTKQLPIYESELKKALALEDKPYIRACDSEDLDYHSVSSSDTLYYRPKLSANQEFDCYPFYSKLGCDAMEKMNQMSKPGLYRGRSTCIRDVLAPYEILRTYASHPSFFSTLPGEGCEVQHVYEKISYVCSCVCRNYENFILALMKSRVNYNYVVVAVRFQKTQNYIYIQIGEGKLEANGHISHFSWILPTLKENGEDPFDASLKINKRKIMALDDLQLPPNYVLTGIKFFRRLISGNEGFGIGLYGRKFDYTTGQLDLTNGTFVIAQQNSSQSDFVEFRGPELVEKNPPKMVLKLNGASVIPQPSSPIGGAGVFYEIASDKTPRLSLRLFTIDYLPHVN